jgi:DNA polymerase III gamma/tau subunit
MWGFSQVPKAPFGKVKEVEIVTQLQSLATKDELEVEEAALSLIAARANGSLHDAERMLDQLSLWDRKVSLAMVQELVSLSSAHVNFCIIMQLCGIGLDVLCN